MDISPAVMYVVIINETWTAHPTGVFCTPRSSIFHLGKLTTEDLPCVMISSDHGIMAGSNYVVT